MASERGTGKTSKQMLAAPEGAVYVWCNGNLDYPRRLAAYLGRTDLQIVAPSWLEGNGWRGREFAGIALDHAGRLSLRQYEYLSAVRIRARAVGESEVRDGK